MAGRGPEVDGWGECSGSEGVVAGKWRSDEQRAGWGWLCRLLAAWLLLSLSLLARADEAIDIDGAKGKLKDNLEAYLGKVSDDDLANWQSTLARLRSSARDAMESMGYYQADMDFHKESKKVKLVVTPGDPVLVHSLNLDIKGEAETDPAFLDLRKQVPLAIGGIFSHGDYETYKSHIQNIALEHGYFDGEWTIHTVQVDIPNHRADINLVYDSGPRYHFGPVSFESTQPGKTININARLLKALVPFKEGDPYDAAKVIKFNKELLDSRYFSDVRVRVQPEKAVNKIIPVTVLASTANPNNIDTGIGYSTDVGARVSANWRRSLLNDSGHSVEVDTQLSQVSHAVDLKYTIPLTHPIDDTLQLLYGVQRQEIDTISSYNTTVGVQRQINSDTGWQQVQSLHFVKESFYIGIDPEGNSDLLLPGLTLTRTRVKGGSIDPYWGDRQFYQIQLASSQVASDANLVYLRSGLRLLRTYDDVHQFLFRLDGGAVFTNNFSKLPPTLRFYAGGDQSVRGYDYQSLAPRDDNGYVVGGRYMLTGSSEYDYQFRPHWRGALFVDAGNAFDSINDPPKVGAGFGVRWISPVGAIRLDFAWALSDPDHPFRFHFSMGSSL